MTELIRQDIAVDKQPGPYRYLLGALALLTLGLYGQRLIAMVHVWLSDSNYSHGFFIPLLAAYFIWDKWDNISQTEVRMPRWSTAMGMALVGLALLMHFAGVVGSEARLSDFSLIVCLYGLVLTFMGPGLFAKVAFPIFFLALMLPPPEGLYHRSTVFMQNWASVASSAILNTIGVAVQNDGNVLHFGYDAQGEPRVLKVAEACSGIRSLLGLLAMGFTLAYLMLKKWTPRIILMLLTVPVAVFCNVLRVTITGFLYDRVSPRFAEDFLHMFTGWVIFIVGLGILLVVVKALHIIFELDVETSEENTPPETRLDTQRSASS